MKEPENYRLILSRLDELYPNTNTLTTKEMAAYCGVSLKTIRQHFSKYTDKVIFAMWLCKQQEEG